MLNNLGKFEADLFVMANATKFVGLTAANNDEYQMTATENLVPDAQGYVTLAHEPIPNTISIAYPDDDGQMNSSTGQSAPGVGVYKLVAPQNDEGWRIQFNVETNGTPGDVIGGDTEVTISYYYNLVNEIDATEGELIEESKIDNRSSAIGEAILVWPVYGSGDECTDSSIVGNVIVKVYKARVTAAPGFDSSYKQANTFAFTLAAMDAKRADNATYSITFVKKDKGIL